MKATSGGNSALDRGGEVIDWFNLAANSLWIIGCALALAAFSYASWQASMFNETLRARLETPGIQRALFFAGLLFCMGQAMLSDSLLVTVLWGVLGLAFCVGLVLAFRR